MPDGRYAIGVVGCGNIGRTHAETYGDHERAEIVAAADLDATALSSFADRFDVGATYDDHEAMLAAEELDVVSICTLHSTHARLTIDAAEAGVDGILCEKPMATSLGEAEDMLDAAGRNGTKLVVAHQRRFDPVHERARALIDDGAIGEPATVAARRGAGLLNWGTHIVDMTRYLLGDPDHEWVLGQVQRRTDRHERGEPIEDLCLAHVCFEGGPRLTYESDTPGPGMVGSSFRVTGTRGVLALNLGSEVTVTTPDGETTYAPPAERSDRIGMVDELFEWLAGERDDHRCSGARALPTTEIMMSVYESVRTNGVVEAPLETRANPLELLIEAGDLPVEHPGAYDIRLPYASLREE